MQSFVNEVLGISDAQAIRYNALPCSMPVTLDEASLKRLKTEESYFSFKMDGERVFVVCDEKANMAIVNRRWEEKPFLLRKPGTSLPSRTIIDAELMKSGALFVLDVILWNGEKQTEKTFAERLELIKDLKQTGDINYPLMCKPWTKTWEIKPAYEDNLPDNCDGFIFVFANSRVHVGRDVNVIKWKPVQTLDFYIDKDGVAFYRYSRQTLAPLKFYQNKDLDAADIDIVLPRTALRNAIVEFRAVLEGNKIVMEEVGARVDKCDPNDLETIDRTFLEVLRKTSLFQEVTG